VNFGLTFKRGWMWVVAVCLLAAGLYFFFIRGDKAQSLAAKQKQDSAARGVPVVAAPAKTGDIGVYLTGLGSVTPVNTVTVKSRVDGQLMEVHFKEGQIVNTGDLLAIVDPRPFAVQLTQAEGQLAHDQALLENARLDLERYKVLWSQDSIQKQQLDTQEALVRQYEGTVKTDQGQIDNAKLNLIYSRIIAPIGGRLGLRQVDPGNIIHASDTGGLVVITQLQPITVVFTIQEDDVRSVMKKLRAGENIPVDAYDRAGKTRLATGTLLTVDNQIDPTTGTVKLKGQFSNNDYALFPNQFVNVRMLVDVKRGATLIPGAAVQRGTQGTFVYVVKSDDTVTVRPVKLGPAEGENVAIDTGIEPDERVVVDGVDKLRDGGKVDVQIPGADRPKRNKQ
jgi:multidrug efflux system membrane fusion protein